MAVSQARAQPAYAGGLGETWARQQQQDEVGDSSEGSSVALNLATSTDLSPSSPNCSYDTDGLPSSPPLASSSPQPAQPPLSPTSSTLRTVQSTLATVQNLQACLSQMTAPPQPLWPPPMQSLPQMPSAMPPLPRLSSSGEVESLRMLLQQQQQAVQQAQQAQAMFLFHPGKNTQQIKTGEKLEIYVQFPPRTSCRAEHSAAAASSGSAACSTGNPSAESTATGSREGRAARRHDKQPTGVTACETRVPETFLPLPTSLPSPPYSLQPAFPLPALINPSLLSLPTPSPTPVSSPWTPWPSASLPSSTLPP